MGFRLKIGKLFDSNKPLNLGGLNLPKLGLAAIAPGAGNLLAQQEANEANRRLQEDANRQNVQLWNQQNEYNTPAAQMKRLETAGLSPQLAYGQIADSRSGTAPTMEAPHYEAAKYNDTGLLEKLATYQQIINYQEMNKKVQLDNLYNAYDINTHMKRGTLRTDPSLLKEILGAFDILGRAGRVVKDRPASDFVHLKKDNR